MSAQPATQTAQPPAQGPMTVEQRVVATHDFLSKLLKGDGKSSPEKICQERWDNWSSVVRVDFLNRSKKAVIALVQRDLPKKQWAQWEITVKFCIDDIINKAIQTKDKKWADNKAVGSLIKTIADRKENEIDPEGFKAKIDKMIADIKDQNVQGVDFNDPAHANALNNIRSIYAAEWAIYMVQRLSQS